MAFFKFRKGGDEQPTPQAAPESVEAIRKRARHRLIGAAVLVLLGVIGFPLVFDNQPRPVSVDIPIAIPDKAKVKPLTPPAAASPSANPTSATAVSPAPNPVATPAAPVAATPAPTGGATASSRVVAGSVGAAPVKPDTKVEAKVEPKAEAKVETKAEAKPAVKSAKSEEMARAEEAAKAQALLEGKAIEKNAAPSDVRYVVQVGAFAEVLKAREARQKLEKAGHKTFVQIVQTKEGKRFRVRVGPFTSKAEADKVAEKIKKLDLPAGVLEL